MTLTETLQLKHKYLQCEDLRALEHCEQRWLEEGCPAERWALVNFIEKMLKELKASGIGYPKILLLRKKEIQRREFVPGVTAETETKNSNTSGLIPADWIAQANRESRENWEKNVAAVAAKKKAECRLAEGQSAALVSHETRNDHIPKGNAR